jgi:hopanoid biosynthesis associated protein HpnK
MFVKRSDSSQHPEITNILIVNADDFGLTHSVNRGIMQCFKNGIVTSTSLLANGKAFEDAVAISQKNHMNIGVHLSLMDGKPVSDIKKIPSLVDNNGCFYKNYISFSLRYFLSLLSHSEIETEFRAQIEKILNAGIAPDHIDGHNHVHIFPGIFDIIIRLMKEYNIKSVRVPCSSAIQFWSNISINSLAKVFLIFLARKARRKTLSNGFFTTDNFEGLFVSGKLLKNDISKILHRLKPGITELMCHPGFTDNETSDLHPWGYQWENELKALCDSDIQNIIRKKKIELITYKHLENLP